MIYRQEAVRDALENKDKIINIYNLVITTIEKVRRETFMFRLDDPIFIVHET
jgi:hypothetical protein